MIKISYDIGTKSLKAVIGNDIEPQEIIIKEHFSDPLKIIREIEENQLPSDRSQIVGTVTGKYRYILLNNSSIKPLDWTIPVIHYTSRLADDIQYVIDIGAASLSLLEIRKGRFHRFQTNSLCASGTGSFLDQQMIRMELSFRDLEKIKPTRRIPSIASRCAVFAKSDLIHRQQEGYSVEELWNGLTKGMAESCYTTLLRGTAIEGKILLIGGLVKNPLFYHYFSRLIPENKLIIPEKPESFVALSGYHFIHSEENLHSYSSNKPVKTSQAFEKRLTFRPSENKEHLKHRYIDRYGNEISIDVISDNQTIPVFLGIDIGSTSTKGVVRNSETGEILFNFYRRTSGNPIAAYQKLLKGIKEYQNIHQLDLQVKGMGTTGSGRKIVGSYAGADMITNEITAHLKGALREHKDVRTIFEIGGQDSKYILVDDGWMKDANMNYACAAGTGSFLEEQAQVLNIGLDDFETLSAGVSAPKMNDRCTVFMEMDAQKLIVDGHSKEEVVTSLLHAVCRNYLHRVVQNRPVSEPILFLGATARNRGLVEAFQNILGKKIKTSRHSHIMGALGMTELLIREMTGKETLFKGWDLDDQKIDFKERQCDKCQNRCLIIYLETEDSVVSWGQKCGEDTKSRKTDDRYRKYFSFPGSDNPVRYHSAGEKAGSEPSSDRGRIITIPKTLFFYSHSQFWYKFWSELDFTIESSPSSSRETTGLGLKYSPNEICYPMKLAMGHIIYLLKNRKKNIFVPYIIRDTKNSKTTNSYFCVITQSFPAIINSILNYNKIESSELITPVIDFSEAKEKNIKRLHRYLSQRFSLTEKEIAEAFTKAETLQRKSIDDTYEQSLELSKILSSDNKPVLVVMGRAYNLYDEALNLALIKDTAKYGFTLIPYDLIPARREEINPVYNNMYWSYGQKFFSAAEKLNSFPNFFPLFLTNFNCGPDSFILSILEKIWSDKPFLILELDEHSGNAGYMTRIEAFLDRIKSYQEAKTVKQNGEKENSLLSGELKKQRDNKDVGYKNKKLLFPPMHPHGTRLLAAAFRAHNFDAVPLKKENRETYQKGKACLRGSECLPAASTFGSLLDYYEENNPDSHSNTALFMPCASGPCRFGQYGFLQKMILERLGLDIEVFSANSENNYGDVSGKLRLLIAKAVVITDIIVKLGCKLRPYASNPEKVELLLEKNTSSLIRAIETQNQLSETLTSFYRELLSLHIDISETKPLVGIVGEIYVRCSPFSNDNLIKKIEEHGAEAWVAPFMEWLHYTTWLKKKKSVPLTEVIKDIVSNNIVAAIENKYYRLFKDMLKDRLEPTTQEMIDKAVPYLSESIRGEALLTIGRTIAFIEGGAKLIINVAPFSCMPGTISSVILNQISKEYSVPIVTLFYDGFSNFDHQLEHYLNNL
jgi:predicted CoA-substrate-specific enzyme activase